jgi:hypothetical protein
VSGEAFTENVVIADFQIGDSTGFNAVILGGAAQSGKGMDHVPFAHGRITVDDRMGKQTASITDLDVGAHVSERTDLHTVADNGTVGNNCSRMNTHKFNYSL